MAYSGNHHHHHHRKRLEAPVPCSFLKGPASLMKLVYGPKYANESRRVLKGRKEKGRGFNPCYKTTDFYSLLPFLVEGVRIEPRG